jgi:hypothetical protein
MIMGVLVDYIVFARSEATKQSIDRRSWIASLRSQ